MTPHEISVVIPTFNEVDNLESCVESIRQCGAGQIVISDGSSDDGTRELAEELRVDAIVESERGRGPQLARGAGAVTGRVILFLHADNQLAPNALHQICEQAKSLADDGERLVWGAFHQRIKSPHRMYRWIERGNAARIKYRSMAFGDQAIFVARDTLQQIGGFPEIPLMEDVVLSNELRKLAKPLLLPGPVYISTRRWEKNGIARQTLRNWWLQIRFACGASPDELVQRYEA